MTVRGRNKGRVAALTLTRRGALWVHRYVGLLLVVFLVVAGLTGSLLAFNEELDTALNPSLMRVAPPVPGASLLPPFELTRRIQEQLPEGEHHRRVDFELHADKSASFWTELADDRYRQTFVDPYTGRVLGSRTWADLSEGVTNLMPFVYRLHYSLALGELGSLLFGIAALLWTLDCFVGAYLTFPVAHGASSSRSPVDWLRRWSSAFLVRTGKGFSLVFTWHRASGLWLWAMLLVFAWSAVGMNLHQVYRPVMSTLAGMHPSAHDELPQLKPPYPSPRLSLAQAHAVGRRLMAAEADKRGFAIQREVRLEYAADHGAFSYRVASDLDISKYAQTQVYFHADDGRLLGFEAPSGMSAGGTITSWLYALHLAAVFGLWYRLLVAILGISVVALSITGVWIWWRKRHRRNTRDSAPQPVPSQSAPAFSEPSRPRRRFQAS